MAAIAHRDAERYLAKPNRSHFLFLVFGSDQGLVVERSRKILQLASPGAAEPPNPVELSGDSIAADPGVLIDEIRSIGLFDDAPRPIRIELGSRSIIPALEIIAHTLQTNRILVIRAGEIRRDAPLRKWFEKQNFAVAIECHADQAHDIEGLLETALAPAKLALEPDARDLLLARLGEDRLLTRSEVEKILLYAHGQRTIAARELANILTDGSKIDFDTLVTDCFSGHLSRLTGIASKISLQAGDYAWLIATILRYALALHRARADIEAGAAFDAAHQVLLRATNAYGRKSETARQLQNISAEKAAAVVNATYFTIKKTRQSGILSEDQLFQLLMGIAQSLRERARHN